MNDNERIEKVYSKYTIKDFWSFWSRDQNAIMEVRIKDFPLIKEIKDKLSIPISASGVYVSDADTLKRVIGYTRDKAIMWFGINPKRLVYNKWEKLGYSGKDVGVDAIYFLFIDIDPIAKGVVNRDIHLKNANQMADILISKMAENSWAERYIKICSGYGIQLLFALDVPINMPLLEYDKKLKDYIYSDEFDRLKNIIKKGICKDILKATKADSDRLGVSIDPNVGNIGGVASLPFTYNMKYNNKVPRGIIHIQNIGDNNGLTHFILSKDEAPLEYKKSNTFAPKKTNPRYFVKTGDMENDPLIKMLLEVDLPTGAVNNTVWFQCKCLLRDSGIDFNSQEFKTVHKKIEHKLNGTLTCNIPDAKYQFNPETINKYCILNGLKVIYPLKMKKSEASLLGLEGKEINWILHNSPSLKTTLSNDGDIFEDIKKFKTELIRHPEPGYLDNIRRVSGFLKAVIEKYGEEKTKYFCDEGILDYYIKKD